MKVTIEPIHTNIPTKKEPAKKSASDPIEQMELVILLNELGTVVDRLAIDMHRVQREIDELGSRVEKHGVK